MNSILGHLVKIANDLDSAALYKEADVIDLILIKMAMSLSDAARILGVSIEASPEEINMAFKQKALKAHPDVGGTTAQMQQLNVARDLLLDKPHAQSGHSEWAPSQPFHEEPPAYVKKVSWDDAMKEAGVPSGVNWKFITNVGSSAYLGDTSAFGFVVYGDIDTQHVFVGVYNYKERNHFTKTDVDTYKMRVTTSPKALGNLADIAPGIIRDLWGDFSLVKGYNAKVTLLPPGTEFNEKLHYSRHGDAMSFKDAMKILGEKPTTWKESSKVDITIKLDRGQQFNDYLITFMVNGVPYQLDYETSEKITKKSNMLSFIFGQYYYADSKKNITRMEKTKANKVFKYLIKKLEGKVPDELLEAFKTADAQTQGDKADDGMDNIDAIVRSNGLDGNTVTDQSSGFYGGLSDAYFYRSPGSVESNL